LQRLHPIFDARVNRDIDAVTTELAAHGVDTPRVVRTQAGALWVDCDGQAWRALTWIAGETVDRVPSPEWAEAAGELVGRYHRALASFNYSYEFTRAGVHDTAAHLAKLAARTAGAIRDERSELASAILSAATELPEMPRALPLRHCHGDLKISNVRFVRDPVRAAALVDLDTVARGTLAFELGDALRSWCNPLGEDGNEAVFDRAIFGAAVRGFRRTAPELADGELASIAIGLPTVCLELAARFAVDAFDDSYFGWDASRFASRVEHNLVRARRQLALGRAVIAARDELAELLG
jgi:Ser/Thr protein kinase RdoA (MazF antagonist)